MLSLALLAVDSNGVKLLKGSSSGEEICETNRDADSVDATPIVIQCCNVAQTECTRVKP